MIQEVITHIPPRERNNNKNLDVEEILVSLSLIQSK